MKIPDNIKIYGDLSYRGESPSEDLETVTFFNYLRINYPDTYGILAYHPRNEGKRNIHQITKEKAQGLVTGTCDIIVVGKPALCIEMKKENHIKSKLTKEQIIYLRAAQQAGAFSCIALGHKAAIEAFNDWQKMLDK